jgi:tRNA dimethylallyltransferase
MDSFKQLIAVVGPTCTGKTELSIELAKKLQGEVVASDSRTIYKKMDIGTAKPTPEQQHTIKHHALDILEPNRFFTVSEYVQIARPAINSILSAGKLPIICGGTGLYARALLEGIQIPPVPPQPDLRQELNDFAEKNSNEALYAWLNKLDSTTADRLNINDRRRIIRALEVCLVTGKPFSLLATKGDPPFQSLWIGLKWNNRSQHKELIAKRLYRQLDSGLLDEIKELWSEPKYRPLLSSAVNYKEFIPYLHKTISWEDACQQCIQDNYQLAKKQMIWFNANSSIKWLILDDSPAAALLSKALELWQSSSKHNNPS